MAQQKNALSDAELLAQFEEFEGIGSTSAANASLSSASKPAKPPPASASAAASQHDDPLAELESLAKATPASRPNTPRAARREAATPTSGGSARTSEDKPRPAAPPPKLHESTRSFHQGLTPTSEESAEGRGAAEPLAQQEPAAAGGWWGGIVATASAAVKQAEAAVKDLQKNEEAQKWVEQVRGNVGNLNKLGGELRSRAMPTFTSIIQTIAPPIAQHERLQIHITTDFVGYPSLNPTIYSAFSRVMAQVEGGDLLVIQRGSEAGHRRSSETGRNSTTSGWNDGPWWRDGAVKRHLGVVSGLAEGSTLCRANAESYATEFFAAQGGLDEAAKRATQGVSESNPVRSSHIFIAIQAVGFDADEALFRQPATEKNDSGVQDAEDKDHQVVFAVYLHDPVHNIDFSTLTQPFPRKWAEWLDAENVAEGEMQLPEEIVEIVHAGGVDPREWVSEWLDELLSLGLGVVAQRYVARRMGVGEGGIGKGKAAAIDAGAGEIARANLGI